MRGWKLLSSCEISTITDYLYDKFGIKKEISNRYIYFRYRNWIFISTSYLNDIIVKIRPKRIGVKIFKIRGHILEPTNILPQIFKEYIRKNIIPLSKDELKILINRGFIKKKLDIPDYTYLIINFNGHLIGVAKYRRGILTCNLNYLINTIF